MFNHASFKYACLRLASLILARSKSTFLRCVCAKLVFDRSSSWPLLYSVPFHERFPIAVSAARTTLSAEQLTGCQSAPAGTTPPQAPTPGASKDSRAPFASVALHRYPNPTASTAIILALETEISEAIQLIEADGGQFALLRWTNFIRALRRERGSQHLARCRAPGAGASCRNGTAVAPWRARQRRRSTA